MSYIKSSMSAGKVAPTFDHNKVDTVGFRKLGNREQDIALDFPAESIPAEQLPHVTVITVTRNRKDFFPLAIDNWNRIYYPHDKLTWLVVDDSDDLEQSPVRILKAEKDTRILFYYEKPKTEGDKIIPYSIGYKRNLAMSLIKTDLAVMMDDDDFMYKDSIIARVCTLVFNKKQCVYSDKMGVYHVHNESSYVLEDFKDVQEGGLMFTKKWWSEQKFSETSCSEGMGLIVNREKDCIKIPFFFNGIVLNHNKNITQRTRNIKFNVKERHKAESIKASKNFYKDDFPLSFQKALNDVKDKI